MGDLRPLVAGRWPFPRPALTLAPCLQGADLRGLDQWSGSWFFRSRASTPRVLVLDRCRSRHVVQLDRASRAAARGASTRCLRRRSLAGICGEPCWTPFMVLSKTPLHRRPRCASTPGSGSLHRLRPGAASSRVPFRPCRFSRLRRLSPRVRCRFVAPCSRSWGSPGFRRMPTPGSRCRPAEAEVHGGGPRCLHPWRPGSCRDDRLAARVSGRIRSRGRRTASVLRRGAAGLGVVQEDIGSTRSRKTRSLAMTLRPSRLRRCRRCANPACATRLHLVCCFLRHSHRRNALRSFSLTHSPVRFQVTRSDAPPSFFRPRGFYPCVNPSPPPV